MITSSPDSTAVVLIAARSLPVFGSGHGDRRDDVAGDAAGEVFVLLLLGGKGNDIGYDDVGMEGRGKPRVVRPDHLFGHDDGVEEIRTEAAVFLWHAHREEALFAHLLPGFAGDDPRLLPLLDVGGDFLSKKSPQRIPEHPMFIRVLQNFHVILPYYNIGSSITSAPAKTTAASLA
jgi:hypothetical protein